MRGSLLHEAEQLQRRAIQTLELAQVRDGRRTEDEAERK